MAGPALHPKLLAVLGVFLLLVSCSAKTYAPVKDQGAPVRQPEARYREVRSGDTLYSIAWESGRDFRELAAWNDIEAPYTIKPGQRLRLYPPGRAKPSKQGGRTVEEAYYIVRPGDTLYGIARARGLRAKDLAIANGMAPPYLLRPGQRLRIDPTTQEARVNSTPAKSADAARVPEADAFDREGTIAWIWPTDGSVTARFAASGNNKGIDISGQSGQPIRAAAAGRVVYEGSGLRGYGQLIILKHNAEFLSAYAHCAATYVREGSVIKPGQKIAEMGSTGTDRSKLHFEIRRRGVPVDPLEYLPKK